MHRVTNLLLACAVVLTLGLGIQVARLDGSVVAYTKAKGIDMATITVTWTSSGLPVMFTSTRGPDESTEAWRVRVTDEVAKMKLAFPPDP